MRYRVLAYFCGLATIAYIQRGAISVPAQEIAANLGLQNLARDMGYVQSAWYLGYAVLQLPAGWLADRWGSRRAEALFCTLWSLSTLLAGLSTDFWSLVILWGLMGACQAGAFPCAAKAIGQIFPDSERARASGWLASGMMVGGALMPVVTSQLLLRLTPWAADWEVFRWRLLLAVYALPGLLWTVAFWWHIPAHVLEGPRAPSAGGPAVDWSRMLRSGPLLLLCAQQFFRAAAMVFFLTWFPVFLQQTRGVSVSDSGWMTTCTGIGGLLGSLTGGFVSDWLLRTTGHRRLARQGIAVVGMSSCAGLIVWSYFLQGNSQSIAVISLGVFCASFGGISGYTVAIEYSGRQVATVFSVMNMCGNIGAMLFPVTAGWLVSASGSWNLILFFFAGIMAIDALCWALLNPRETLFGDPLGGPLHAPR